MKARPTLAATCAAAVVVIGVTPAAVAAGTRGVSDRPHAQAHGLSWAPSARLPRTYLPHLGRNSQANSTNWSGYAAVAGTGTQLRFIQASFNLPSVNCSKSPPGSSGYAYVSHWVGIDGDDSATVEQTGVSGYCTSTTGTPSYYAWYEMYPLAPVAFTGVSPGDAIKVFVYFTGSAYRIWLTDLTNGGFIHTTQSCPSGSTCKNASAEVITEDPGGAVASGYNLADFGMENYTGAAVTSMAGNHGTLSGGLGWTSSEITMVDASSATLASPSSLAGGTAFEVTWKSAT